MGWAKKKLGDVCIVERGSSPRPIKNFQTDSADGVNWIKIGDTKGVGKYITSTKEKITKEGAKKSRRVDDGDFILSNSMSFGKPYIMATSGYIHDGWFVLRLPDYIDTNFFYYLLSSPLIQDQFQSLSSGAIVKNISGDLVKKAVLPIPPLEEQKRIVAILDQAFDDIKQALVKTEQNLKNAHELFESYLQQIFSQRGNGWVEYKMPDVCEINSKLIDPKADEYLDFLHVGAGNMVSNTGDLEGVKTAREEGLISGKFVFDNSMVLYSKIRPYLKKVCRPEFSGLCSADVYPLSPIAEKLDKNYLFYLLLSKDFTDYAISGSGRAGMPKVNRTHLFNYKVFLPSLKLQRELVKGIDEMLIQSQLLEKKYISKLNKLGELKKSILQKAFSGELTKDSKGVAV